MKEGWIIIIIIKLIKQNLNHLIHVDCKVVHAHKYLQ